MDKFSEFPQDKNLAPIYSATRKKMVVITGDDTWKDLIVPDGFECKSAMIVVHDGNSSIYTHIASGLEYLYRIDSEATSTEWIPMSSGPVPFAGKTGALLGQLKAAAGKFISVLMMA